MSETALRSALVAAVGADHVLTATDAIAPYLTDWRKRYTGRAQAVVRPASTAEVAAVARACADHGAPIVPQGGNTGLVGGGTPDDSGRAVLLSLTRMNRVRQIDPANDTITVEAGCVLQQVQEAARARGRLFPLSLAAEGSATIGGNLSSNAGGTQVLRYGNARDLALGLEVVLAGGLVWDGLRGLRKDNTGYDLKHLFIGAEGTLGIITAATLKLFPLPRAQLTALAAVPSLDHALALLDRARAAAGAALTGFEVMSAECLRRVARELPQLRQPLPPTAAPWFALLELSDAEDEAHASALLERLFAAAFDAGEVIDAVVAQSIAEARALWAIREGIPEAQARAGGNVKHDISLPVDPVLRRRHQRGPGGALCVDRTGGVRPSGRRQSALQHGGQGRHAGCLGLCAGSGDQPHRARRGGCRRRLDQRRARAGPDEARGDPALQVAGGTGADAVDQAGARSARADEPRQAVVAAHPGCRTALAARGAGSSLPLTRAQLARPHDRMTA